MRIVGAIEPEICVNAEGTLDRGLALLHGDDWRKVGLDRAFGDSGYIGIARCAHGKSAELARDLRRAVGVELHRQRGGLRVLGVGELPAIVDVPFSVEEPSLAECVLARDDIQRARACRGEPSRQLWSSSQRRNVLSASASLSPFLVASSTL